MTSSAGDDDATADVATPAQGRTGSAVMQAELDWRMDDPATRTHISTCVFY